MRFSRKRIWWVAAAAVMLAVLLWALRPEPLPVEAAVVSRGPLQVTIEEDGLTRVVRHVEVAAPVSGRLAESRLRAGDTVTRGAVVGVLQPAPLETHSTEERERLFFEAMMRVLDRELPGYRD